MKFQTIDDHRGDYPVELMCRVFGVSKGGYYDWRDRASAKPRVSAAFNNQ